MPLEANFNNFDFFDGTPKNIIRFALVQVVDDARGFVSGRHADADAISHLKIHKTLKFGHQYKF